MTPIAPVTVGHSVRDHRLTVHVCNVGGLVCDEWTVESEKVKFALLIVVCGERMAVEYETEAERDAMYKAISAVMIREHGESDDEMLPGQRH